ncbi:MAG: VIT1/CCC1 transporter family protein [Candidatus Woesearchaeota archaeon]
MVSHEHVLGPEPVHNGWAAKISEIILGGQDGLVNVLGIVLGVAAATMNTRIVIISGLAATFAESISMGAVAYTSTKAAKEYYLSLRKKELMEIRKMPGQERKEVADIYYHKGFRGRFLNQIVNKLTSSRRLWLDTMMAEELKVFPEEYHNPLKAGVIVGIASIVGSLIPLLPFFFLSAFSSVWVSLAVCTLALFVVGSIKAKITVGAWWKSGFELACIGMAAAIVSYAIGMFLGVTI